MSHRFRYVFMGHDFDLRFFYQVKAKYLPLKGALIFISAANGENIDSLEPLVFTAETYFEFELIMQEHWDKEWAYFAVSYLDRDFPIFMYACQDYLREEDYKSKQAQFFKLNPFKKFVLDVDVLKLEIAKLRHAFTNDDKSQAS